MNQLHESLDELESNISIQVDNSSVTWRKICEQLDKPRISISPKEFFFFKLRENLKTKDQNRLRKLKESK